MSEGKTDPTGIIQSLQAQASPGALVRPDALDRLIRRFVADVIDVLHKTQQEGLTRDAGASTVEASCRFYAGILTGRVKEEGFEGGGAWLERGLPDYLRAHHGIGSGGEEAIAEAFARVAKRVFSIVGEDDGHEASIDRLVRSSLALFGGMGGDEPSSAVS